MWSLIYALYNALDVVVLDTTRFCEYQRHNPFTDLKDYQKFVYWRNSDFFSTAIVVHT